MKIQNLKRENIKWIFPTWNSTESYLQVLASPPKYYNLFFHFEKVYILTLKSNGREKGQEQIKTILKNTAGELTRCQDIKQLTPLLWYKDRQLDQ